MTALRDAPAGTPSPRTARTTQAFPFAGKVPGPICAFCCIQCIPNAGIMKPPGGGGAPPNAEMNR